MTILDQAKANLDKELDQAVKAGLKRWQRHLDKHELKEVYKGGPGSGNFGHAGRPGKVGGSAPKTGVGAVMSIRTGRAAAERAGYKPAKQPLDNSFYAEDHYKLLPFDVDEFDDWEGARGMAGEYAHEQLSASKAGVVIRDGDEVVAIASFGPPASGNAADLGIEWLATKRPGYGKQAMLSIASQAVKEDRTVSLRAMYAAVGFYDKLGLDKSPHDSYEYSWSVPDMKNALGAAGYKEIVDDEPEDGVFVGNVDILVEKQLPISDDNKKVLLQARINIFNDESDALAERVYNGDISIGQWQDEMKGLVKGLNTSSAAIGKGGWDLMSQRDWGRLGTPNREQYKFLKGFAQDISDNRDTISLAYLKNRARLYGEAAANVATEAEAGFWWKDKLPWLPRDGTTACLVRCHCKWVLQIIEARATFNMVEAVWRLGEADHCDDCTSRDGHREIIKTPLDVDVPIQIGGY